MQLRTQTDDHKPAPSLLIPLCATVVLACALAAAPTFAAPAKAEPPETASNTKSTAAAVSEQDAESAPAKTRRRGRRHHHIGIGVGYGHYRPYGYGHYGHYGPYGYGPIYGGWGGYPYGGYGPYGYGHEARYRNKFLGAIDINVKPKKTQVYLDGSLIGKAGEFDGQPRYLWLDKGAHELIFYLDGHESVVRKVTARPGLVIPLKLHMQPGHATAPEELTSVDSDSPPVPRNPPMATSGREEGTAWWREKTSPERYSGSGYETAAPEAYDARQPPARLRLSIQPADASVYLDGRFLGLARDLAELGSGLLIDPGEHRLEVIHPAFASAEKSFSAETGKEVGLELELRAK